MAEAKLTVLQLVPALESGGVERGTLEVAQALVGHGYRAMVMSVCFSECDRSSYYC